jgi:hypothetical protein
LPLGWYPGCGVFDDVPRGLPGDVASSGSAPSRPLPAPSGDCWDDRPIDVLFIGSHSPRRERWLAALQADLPALRWSVHMPSDRAPLTGHGPDSLHTADAVAAARRAKVLLNVHRDDAVTYFEWQRIVWRGLWQRTLRTPPR